MAKNDQPLEGFTIELTPADVMLLQQVLPALQLNMQSSKVRDALFEKVQAGIQAQVKPSGKRPRRK